MSRLTIIVAATKSNGIGKNGRLPWHIPKDMAYFAHVTSLAPPGKKNAIVMGRNTWESIPKKYRPLANRLNHVISKNETYDLDGKASLHNSLESALQEIAATDEVHRVFIIGGASIYNESLKLQPGLLAFVDRVLLTRVSSPAYEDCDTFMPQFMGQNEGVGDGYQGWKRTSHGELQEWTGIDADEGLQSQNGAEFEFQMWVRC